MRTRQVEIVAQDPDLTRRGRVVTAKISLPLEDLEDGPMGSSVYVVDYDASTGSMYRAASTHNKYEIVAPPNRKSLLGDPVYQAWNVYAIVMRILLRFEFALGRRVG